MSVEIFPSEDLASKPSPRVIRDYIRKVGRINRQATLELEEDVEIIHQVIASSPGIPILMGMDMRRRAKWIVDPLSEAANAHNAARNLSILAWQRFQRQFGPAMEAASKGRSKGRPTMDWSDV